MDTIQCARVYNEVGYDGMLMPDHVPRIEGGGGGRQAFAFLFGYIAAVLQMAATIRFNDLRALVKALGFAEHVKGSHHIFTRPEVPEILNLQPRGSMAKPYQVKQVRAVIVRHKLAGGTE